MANDKRPTLAVFKFASCDGCQLSILNMEDELLALAGAVDIAYFIEARSQMREGPYDVTLVEGSITTAEDKRRIQEVRKQSKYLVTIGACATAGGIQALRNFMEMDDLVRAVYARPAYIEALAESTPVASHVPVDFELNGCPVSKAQLLEVLVSLLLGRMPRLPGHAVCVDCKRRGVPCILVSQGVPCLGPVTRTGCNALCPSFGRGCFGCYGPMESAHPEPLLARLHQDGASPEQIVRLLRGFTGYSETFRAAAQAWEKKPQ